VSYKIRHTKKVEKEIALLSNDDYSRIATAIGSLATNPRPVGSRKLKGYEGDWRMRVGMFRILYSVDDKEKLVIVRRVAHRKEAYRGL
jgi:mRNA interferase RelE/StbE